MRYYRTKQKIKDQLISSLETGEGIHVKASGMGSGSHHYYLTYDEEESYIIHCYGSGTNWRDQDSDCRIQDLDTLVSRLWAERADIIE